DRKFRVRTIKLRKQVSQGLVLPLSILPAGKTYKESDDVTEVLGIKKYDPQAEQEAKLLQNTLHKTKIWYPKFLMRFKWFRKLVIKPKRGGFPAWIVKTDEERIQNKTSMFNIEKENGTKFIVTEKIDGQSGTYYLERISKRKYIFGVCSRNIHLAKPDNSSYWTIARQFEIEKCLKSLIEDHSRIVLQGEIIGTGIQGNKYRVNGYDFYAFNLIIDGNKINTVEMANFLGLYGIKTVPVVEEDMELKDSIQDMVDYSKGNSVLVPSQKREGVVIRNYDRNISFKVINPDFLLAEKD
ncbi:MAG: RNA ligase family protein, partial [Agathobacter sp.]